MAQTQTQVKFIAFFTIIISLLFLTLMLSQGATLLISVMASLLMGGLTAVMATMSYVYKGFLQRRSFSGKKVSSQSISNHQQATVEIDASFDVAFDLAMDALQTLNKQRVPVPDDILVKMDMILPRTQHLKIRTSNKADGFIEAGLRGRALGIPEFIDFSRIMIRLEKVDSQTTRVHIESKGHTMMDMYDFGKNLHYVNQIALYLRKESQQSVAESRLSVSQSDEIEDMNGDDESQESASNQT